MRRRKNIMIKKLITLGIASLMTVLMLVPSFAGEVLLKLPTWFGTHLPSLGTSPLFIESNINAVDTGLKVKLYEPNKLIPNKGMLEAVSKGQINSGYTFPAIMLFHYHSKSKQGTQVHQDQKEQLKR